MPDTFENEQTNKPQPAFFPPEIRVTGCRKTGQAK